MMMVSMPKGLELSKNLQKKYFDEIFVVAPASEQSGVAHCFTYKRKYKYNKIDEHHYTIEGTPADCVIAGLHYILKDNPPDLVLFRCQSW